MNSRKSNLLLAAFLAITLVMPMLAANVTVSPQINTTQNHSPAAEEPNIQTIEGAGAFVDAWGGVYDVVATVQNASHYGYDHTNAIKDVLDDQTTNEDGYVSQIVFNVAGMTPFPNGAMGASMAVLQLSVSPVYVIPLSDPSYYEEVSESEAIDLAEDIVEIYETAFNLDLQRLEIVDGGFTYQMTYIAILQVDGGVGALNTMRTRLASLGGFMDLAAGTGWTNLLTTTTETIMPFMRRPTMSHVDTILEGISYSMYPYYRPEGDQPDYETEIEIIIGAEISQSVPNQVQAVAGDEVYNPLVHLGLAGNLQNKMQQVDTAESISILVGATPAHLEMGGIPTDWSIEDDSYEIPSSIYLPGKTIPAGSDLSEVITAYLSYLPSYYAMQVHTSIESISETMFDPFIDSLWGGVGTFPDFQELFLDYDEDDFPETPIVELNLDLLADIMEQAGMNPSALVDYVDMDVYDDNPPAALALAFIQYFDAYNLLDILDDDIYADAPELESYLNTMIEGIEVFMDDFAGINFPAEFQTKEDLADFVDTHWELNLGALWYAMADDNLADIKDAVHDMLDTTNLQEHITPFLKADIGASLVAGLGFAGAVNWDIDDSTPTLETIDTDTWTLTFDSDPEALNIDGPYLTVVKAPSVREINEGGIITYTMTVHNYGDATAYDIKVLDGMSAGLDGEREFYWTHDSLAAGETWTFTYDVVANDTGLYMDMPAICVYFNTTLSSFSPTSPGDWEGTARYTISAPGYQILVTGGWWPPTILGIPTLYLVAGVGGVAVVGVAILLVRRRP
ncbi:MAG: DUF11 domain-containing protein [Candidatus Lokiarchaeota archaeon]|nr:DUF11 domain-containing protein [Candidatus Lokiarchaeota archaeon]